MIRKMNIPWTPASPGKQQNSCAQRRMSSEEGVGSECGMNFEMMLYDLTPAVSPEGQGLVANSLTMVEGGFDHLVEASDTELPDLKDISYFSENDEAQELDTALHGKHNPDEPPDQGNTLSLTVRQVFKLSEPRLDTSPGAEPEQVRSDQGTISRIPLDESVDQSTPTIPLVIMPPDEPALDLQLGASAITHQEIAQLPSMNGAISRTGPPATTNWVEALAKRLKSVSAPEQPGSLRFILSNDGLGDVQVEVFRAKQLTIRLSSDSLSILTLMQHDEQSLRETLGRLNDDDYEIIFSSQDRDSQNNGQYRTTRNHENARGIIPAVETEQIDQLSTLSPCGSGALNIRL